MGARRIFNFKKYLEKSGHRVTVLTVDKGCYEQIDPRLDDAARLKDVVRTHCSLYVRVPPRKKAEGRPEGLVRRGLRIAGGADARWTR